MGEQERLGFLGLSPTEALSHSRRYEAALPVDVRVIDLGSGGGLPGLVIAVDRPDLRLTLLDARQKRTDQLRRLVGRLGLAARVEVVCDRVERFSARIAAPYDVLVARKFGPPAEVVAAARALVRPGGLIVVSDAPDDRWELTVVAERLIRLPAPEGLVVVQVPDGDDLSSVPAG